MLIQHLQDVWRKAGWGVGHSFPGLMAEPDLRIQAAGFTVPPWIIRIDYILASKEWQPVEARVGVWHGESDHRPVLARLILR